MRAFARPMVDLSSVPMDFDRLIEWFDLFSHRLVLLDESPRGELRGALEAMSEAVRRHCLDFGAALRSCAAANDPGAARARTLLADHARYTTSLDQLWWFYGVVEREDHGGHRQALGQYGRVLAESLRRHRSEEHRLLDRRRGEPSRLPTHDAAGNPK